MGYINSIQRYNNTLVLPSHQMLDKHGYRPNVGIVLMNQEQKVLIARRIDEQSWQFPQGGIQNQETPLQAMYRELFEEVGLRHYMVEVLGRTKTWLHYDVPQQYIRSQHQGFYKGQKQMWYLLKMLTDDVDIDVSHNPEPEFDAWMWCDYWQPVSWVINFKKPVYYRALRELEVFFPKNPLRRSRSNSSDSI